MLIMGINSYFEHPSVALLLDGKLLFAAEDERFTRIKHGRRYNPFNPYLPVDAIYAALNSTGLNTGDIDALAYSYSGREHLYGMWSCITGRRNSTIREELAAYNSLRRIRPLLGSTYSYSCRHRKLINPKYLASLPFHEWPHHDCHAASAFYCSGYEQALIIVCDGAGERHSTTIYIGRGDRIKALTTFPIQCSLGIFYSFITAHLGFEMFADEFKVMGLAAYGCNRFVPQLRNILRTLDGGRYDLNIQALSSLQTLIGGRRSPQEAIGDIHHDIAHSAQVVLEETLEHVISHHLQQSQLSRICLSGGVFMNCVANGRIAKAGLAEKIFVQPASHDGGTAIGAAALSWKATGGHGGVQWRTMALGTEYSDESIRNAMEMANVEYEPLKLDRVCNYLEKGQIGALFRGRMEFGSRALGQRSIIASPCYSGIRAKLNAIKAREDFRPVAPMINIEAFSNYFIGYPNAHMSFSVEVREAMRSQIPACVHVDGTARPQVVDSMDHPFLHELLANFGRRSGHPLLINTSFNTRGQPIVETPYQAIECFFTTSLDFLVLGGYLVIK